MAYTEKFTLSNGTEIILRGLKRREVKKLRKDKVHPGTLTAEEMGEKGEEVMDSVLEMVLEPDVFILLDELYEQEILKMFKRIMELTYVTEEQAKN